MTAVKRAEDSGGGDSVMDSDSQQVCVQAQPPALNSSPAQAGAEPEEKTRRRPRC